MPEGTKAKGCVKLRRCSKFRSYYQVQYYQTDKNRRKRMLRHLRSHPNDKQTQERAGVQNISDIELTSKGRKRLDAVLVLE
jgi:Family of unknown function (DUF7022)